MTLALGKPASALELSPSVHWAQRHYRSPSFQWRRRIYDYELLFVVRGELLVTLRDEGISFPVQANAFLFLQAGSHHEIQVRSEPDAELLGIHFDFFDELEVRQDRDIIVDEQDVRSASFCALPLIDGAPALPSDRAIAAPGHVASLMEFIIQEWNGRLPGYELLCKSLLLQAIGLLMRHKDAESRAPHPKYEARLRTLVQQLEEQYARRWTNAEMAAYLNVHEDYMSRLFKDLLGRSPGSYLQSIRHHHAKRLLRETEDKIEAVALQVGYEDIHYFSRQFKKWEGMSAQQYRRFARLV
ncbi:helix-turn-helix transcriptional regulator [Cohnella phaseoli]|uniref:AraC-like DNA-binding protein n=1 Tax=Cohnella phaseoli TaxID=456490 RepID=A0A3D9KPL9_9BACL|nr:helix-turn-helix domain-containing protein [Cohnella phaseoli]RED87877.1 AraC-like DNA-binding protein [Cohnella phaseoli]